MDEGRIQNRMADLQAYGKRPGGRMEERRTWKREVWTGNCCYRRRAGGGYFTLRRGILESRSLN